MPRVVHFEFMAEDPERANRFYQEVFGWKVDKWEGPVDYWLVSTGPQEELGIDGGIARSEGDQPCVVTVDVASVDEAAEKVVQAGGQVVRPKMAVPGVGYMVYCQDTEGVLFGMMESDPSAK